MTHFATMDGHYLPTPENLGYVRDHLERFGSFPENETMLKRLADHGVRTEYDQNFLDHELVERCYMDEQGMDYDTAHERALSDLGVSPYAIYDTSVVAALPEHFNDNWYSFHGIERE